jgi:hypothetical protein
MEVLIILGVVGLAWLALQRQGTIGPSSIQVAGGLNANARNAQLQLQGINQIEAQPDTTGALEQTGLRAAAGAVNVIPVVGQAVSAILAIGASLLGQHTARVKGATAENSGINAIVPAFDADLKEINAAWLAGSLNPTMAATYLQQVHDQYWAYMQQFVGRPGVATRTCPPGQVGGPMGHGGCTSGQPICDKGCTAGCCVGCSAINGTIANCLWAIQTGYHGPVAVCAVFGSKFGANDRAGYQLSW